MFLLLKEIQDSLLARSQEASVSVQEGPKHFVSGKESWFLFQGPLVMLDLVHLELQRIINI